MLLQVPEAQTRFPQLTTLWTAMKLYLARSLLIKSFKTSTGNKNKNPNRECLCWLFRTFYPYYIRK